MLDIIQLKILPYTTLSHKDKKTGGKNMILSVVQPQYET
jgi:hypothetical protein